MSLAHRIIPCLDTDGERVVKGVNFVGLRDAGDPVALAARYNADGADELVVLDIAASRDRRSTFLETIRRVAAELAIPLTAGGGIRTLEDGRAVVRAGADKVTCRGARGRGQSYGEHRRRRAACADFRIVARVRSASRRPGDRRQTHRRTLGRDGPRRARIRVPRCRRVGTDRSRCRRR